MSVVRSLERPIDALLRAPVTATVARIVLCLPFWWSGFTKLLDFSGGTAEMTGLGLPLPEFFNALTIVVQLGGSFLVIADIYVWLGAGAIGVFTFLATVLAHQFWKLEEIERIQQMNAFLEHLSIIAGFVLVAILASHASRSRGQKRG